MATFLLIRHGHTDHTGVSLSGRLPDIHLNEKGRREAEHIASRWGVQPIQAIYSSPLERAVETALPLARSMDLAVHSHAAFSEIDCGEWAGKKISDLDETPDWKAFNRFRSSLRCPHGESMIEVQARVMNALEELRLRHPDGTVAVFTHADVIKAALVHYAGMPVDHFQRLEISPGSVSVVRVEEWGPQIRLLNGLH